MTIKNAYMLDTNIIIIWARGGYGADVLKEMYAVAPSDHPLFTSIVSVTEPLHHDRNTRCHRATHWTDHRTMCTVCYRLSFPPQARSTLLSKHKKSR